MKKLTALFVFLFLIGTSSYSQEFKFGAGISLELVDLFGISGKAQYMVNEDFAGQASFTFFLEDPGTWWALDLDVLYGGFDIGDVEGFSITPFAGLQVASFSIDIGLGSASDTDIGINLGVQALIDITDSLELFIEPKVTLGGFEGVYLAGGVFF